MIFLFAGGAAPLVPAAASHVLLTLPKAAHNLEVHLGSSEKGFESAGNQLASWANGTSLVTIFPVGDARDEIAAVCRERRQAVQEAGEPEQVSQLRLIVARTKSVPAIMLLDSFVHIKIRYLNCQETV
jgi:hypothetical protein